jgi:hypothetical protein
MDFSKSPFALIEGWAFLFGIKPGMKDQREIRRHPRIYYMMARVELEISGNAALLEAYANNVEIALRRQHA